MAPSNNPGDTVAASVFEPRKPKVKADTAKADTAVKDSVDIFFIGEGSDRCQLVLVSYPSRRDTIIRLRSRYMRVRGNADYGRAVRITLTKDSMVRSVVSLEPPTSHLTTSKPRKANS